MDEQTRWAIDEVEGIYADLEGRAETRDCIGRTTCCRFLLTGKTPMLTAGEAVVAAVGVRASGRKGVPENESGQGDSADGSCPLLKRDGKCSIYAHRPFGCRTHFCQAAGGPYPRAKVQDLIQRLEAVAERIGETDVRPIADAVASALDSLRTTGRKGRRTPKGRWR